jgi:hypothetical protein
MNSRALRRALTAGWLILGVTLALCDISRSRRARAADEDLKVSAGDFKLSGPYSHGNLTIFLIHGEDQFDGKKLLTLEEALDQKTVVVHETGTVSELTVENLSKDEEVFIQSGDIVKGGRQDRLISFSTIVATRSGKVPVPAFCVESGRWQQRGKEAANRFSSSTSQLPSKGLKINGGAYAQLGGNQGFGGGNQGLGGGNQGFGGGNQGLGNNLGRVGGLAGGGANQGFGGNQGGGGNQGMVWSEVSAFQQKLLANAGVEGRAKDSPSSLQLTLENKNVKEAVDHYIQKLAPIVERHSDVIGYAFAIDGKVNSAEVFGSRALFKKLWPKLLRANAIEALAELKKGKKIDPVTPEAVKACILDAEKDKTQRDLVIVQKALTKRISVSVQETDQTIFVETRDRDRKGAWIQRSYVTK